MSTVSKTLEKAKEFKKWNEWDTSTSAEFAEFILQEATAELQKETAEIAKALGIHFCPDLEEPWEVPMEPEPDYFETLPEAAAFLLKLLDKGLSDREKENARLKELLQLYETTHEIVNQHGNTVSCACYLCLKVRAVLSKEKGEKGYSRSLRLDGEGYVR